MNSNTIAIISWIGDVTTSIAVLVLLAAWLSDLNSTNYSSSNNTSNNTEKTNETSLILSPSFSENGFCLSPLFDNTHLVCAKFDAFCGIGFIIIAIFLNKKSCNKESATIKPMLLGTAVYLFAHSWGHYVAGTELVEPGSTKEERMPLGDFITLAAILSVGPMQGVKNLVELGKINQKVSYVLGTVTLAILVAIYGIYIRRPQYALLYINITILLTSVLPMALTVGFTSDKDVTTRSSKFTWLVFVLDLIVTGVVFSEPFFCDTIVAKFGGHLIFDTSLVLQAIASIVNASTKQEKLKIQ